MPTTDLVALPKRTVEVRTPAPVAKPTAGKALVKKPGKALLLYKSPPRFKRERIWPLLLLPCLAIACVALASETTGSVQFGVTIAAAVFVIGAFVVLFW